MLLLLLLLPRSCCGPCCEQTQTSSHRTTREPTWPDEQRHFASMTAPVPLAHVPVLAREIVELLVKQRPLIAARSSPLAGPASKLVFLDATFGAGGHTRLILHGLPDAVVVAADRDVTALERIRTIEPVGVRERIVPVHMRFSEIGRRMRAVQVGDAGTPTRLWGALMDLGVSSMQIDTDGRGFSFQSEGPLDMRMDQNDASTPTAADLVNSMREKDLEDTIRKYGEERYAGRIASAIVSKKPFATTKQLADVVRAVMPFGQYKDTDKHPATRTFQALRIAVNDEMNELKQGLHDIEALMEPGGVLCGTKHDRKIKIKYKKKHFFFLVSAELSLLGGPTCKAVY